MSARTTLTPQMLDYEAKFTDGGDIRWLPYLMYFHPAGHRSATVNTDSSGFRYATAGDRSISVADHDGIDSVRLLAGSSTVFGIGAGSDAGTLPSRLTANDARPEPWLNFGGRSFNSAQEVMLLTLYRHLLPRVEEIVLFSGFNNLGLARQPAARRGEHGSFFNSHQFFEALAPDRDTNSPNAIRRLFGRGPTAEPPLPLAEQIAFAADLTLRHLEIWRIIADDLGATLTYVLQPLAGWVREPGSAEEEQLFAELDALGRFGDVYGDILRPEVNLEYAALLESGAKAMGVGFLNLSPLLAERIDPKRWLFVDRIHFHDDGHDIVARLLLESL
ncbi:inducer of phenazine A [Nocardia terpenica]|uniref:Inducer of phenazine A n=1 Tax=Nocardia terpenica TaxID=455432 RepID=A0A291RKU3_9NOCA|nr:inducer of phenazine A [Nocardia terpenica]ATL68183.1 inducer of phenazine A [Nocardia terpenica]